MNPNEKRLLNDMSVMYANRDIIGMNKLCHENKLHGLLQLLGSTKLLTVKLLCNWTEDLANTWEKMSGNGRGYWHGNKVNIQLTDSPNPDYWVIINKPNDDEKYEEERTIVFQMEPNMTHAQWGEWAFPDPNKFLSVNTHASAYNNIEWHLSKSYSDLLNNPIHKMPGCDNILTSVLSDKYHDPGHILRINFAKYIDNAWLDGPCTYKVFGTLPIFRNSIGPLPYHCKDSALFPYKYHFNAENNSIPNYFTEKLVDCILTETLCFYWGCPNISEHIDQRAYVQLDLDDFEQSLGIVQHCMLTDEWSRRIDVIRQEKTRILKTMQFFPRVCRIIGDNRYLSNKNYPLLL